MAIQTSRYRKLKPFLYGLISVSVVGIAPMEAFAQDQEDEEKVLEEVIVTGSRIKRDDIDGSAPVTIISSEDILNLGATNVGDVVRRLPSVTGSPRSQRGAGGFNDGSVQVDLRGIGPNNTLVLINGRRSVNRGTSSSVDLGSIPFAAIERIEILKDGASAVYGSDAIAGVVNVIMKENYEGLTVDGEWGQSGDSDGTRRSMSMTWGGRFGDDKGHALVSISRHNEDGIFRRDRDISSDADLRRFGGINLRSGRGPATRIRPAVIDGTTDSLLYPTAPYVTNSDGEVEPLHVTAEVPRGQNLPVGSIMDDAALEAAFRPWQYSGTAPCGSTSDICDGYNYHEFESQSNDHNVTSFWASGDYAIGENAKIFTELSLTQVDSRGVFAPAALDFLELSDITRNIVSAQSIYNPFGVDVNVQRRVTEGGIVRPTINDGNTQRIIVGLEDALGNSGWGYELSFNFQSADNLVSRGSQMSIERVRQAIGPSFVDTNGTTSINRCGTPGNVISGCIPLDLIGPSGSVTPEMMEWIFVNKPTEHSINEMKAFTLDFVGPVFSMADGDAQLAVGVERRFEDASIILDRATAEGDVAFVEAQQDTIAPTRKIKEFYAEFLLPVASILNLSAAVRASDYNDFGSSTNPKIGFELRPIEQLLIRGTYSEGFRAPTAGELFGGNAFAFVNFNDPCESASQAELPGCPANSPLPDTLGFSARTGGTSTLRAEEAESNTFGIVWTPSDDFSLTLDYWKIDQTDVVDTIGVLTKLDDVAENGASSIYFSDVVRDAVSGELLYVNDTLVNISKRETSGIDVAMRYRMPDTSVGSFEYGLDIAHMLSRKDDDGDDQVGNWTDRFALPENRITASMDWLRGQWGVYVNMQYIDSMMNIDSPDPINAPTYTLFEVDSYVRFDAQASYTFAGGMDGLRLTLGIHNLLDEDPPLIGTTVDGGHDPTTYDATGRFTYIRLSKEF